MELKYPPLAARRLTGGEPFTANSSPLNDVTVRSFWQWAVSNLSDNVTRGLLAEYLVAVALGADQGTRAAWDAFDVQMPSGVKVEVKCSAYLQAWGHRELSTIRFSIRAARAWDSATNEMAETAGRQADVYVFC